MENDLDLTLKLGLPNPTVVETQLSLSTSTTTDDQGTNVVVDGGRGDNDNNDGGDVFNLPRALRGDDEVVDDEGARNNMDINLRVYEHIFKLFAGAPNTLNFDPYHMPPSPVAPAPALMTHPASDEYVLIDVPASRGQRNNTLLMMANARNESPNAYAKRRRGCGGRIEGTRKCTNLNCNALVTPMWRRGPLGPKSLCNACGIKYRKEQERISKMN